ncbi:MAG: LysM peptidoglycan-binding domain-containing protein [Rickettsiales bacterium]|nr:MAG: LysM peptidoglycan-binding domain-containing protein [Rickettsiales bacterium]
MKKQSFLILLLFISSCAITKKVAPIEYHYGDQQVAKTPVTPFKPKPIIDENEGEIIDNTNVDHDIIEVKQTETLKDITDENQLKDDDFVVSPNQASNQETPIATIKETNTKEQFIYHEVQNGETIEDIAQKYKVATQDIITSNDLVTPYYLDEFQILKIPTSKQKTIKTTPVTDDDDVNILNEEIKPLVKESAPVVEKIATSEFISPLQGEIIVKFGEKTDLGTNKGVSIAAKAGTKILSSTNGKVIYADYDATFGNLVIIKLDNKNIVVSYAHMQDIVLKKGAVIAQGDVVGYVGSTGKVKQPQLHFGIREGKIAKDPMNYIKF